MRTLKSRLKQLKLGRCNLMNETIVQKLDFTIHFTGIGEDYHYNHGLFLPRDTVMLAVKQVYPDALCQNTKIKD